jgi:hypothetical protein
MRSPPPSRSIDSCAAENKFGDSRRIAWLNQPEPPARRTIWSSPPNLSFERRPGSGGQTAALPFIETAVQGSHSLKAAIEQNARQTGARRLVGSGAVENYFLLFAQPVHVEIKLGGRDAHRSGDGHGGAQEGILVAQVYNHYVVARGNELQ